MVLATYFLKRYSDLYDKRIRGFNSPAIESMEAYEWPGNIRELENRIQRAVLLSEGSLVNSVDLGFEERQTNQMALQIEK